MEIMFPLFIFVLIGSIIYATSQYIWFLLMKGDFEDKESYTTFFSFNKTLDNKMKYYPIKKMAWFKFYMNFVLPVFSAILLYNIIFSIATQSVLIPIIFVLNIILFIFTASNAVFIRFIDKTGFVINIVWNAFLVVYVLISLISIDAVFLIIGFLVTCGLPIAANIWYFVKRRELFTYTLKGLKKGIQN